MSRNKKAAEKKSVKESTSRKTINTDKKGLSSQQVAQLKEKHGENTLPHGKRKTRLKHLISQFTSPLIYILVIAGIITYFLQDYKDSAVIFAAVIMNTVLGYYQEVKAERALQALKKMLSPEAKVRRDGKTQKIQSKDIVPGDIVVLGQGDRIPADGEIIESVNASTNEAILTGESTAVRKKKSDEIYMGTYMLSGRAVMKVTNTGRQTKMGSIAKQISVLDDTETPLQRRLNQLAKMLAVVVVSLSSVILLIGLIKGTPFTEIFSTSVALAVASIPEGMAISLTVILAVGMQRILKRKALVRRLVAAETLGSVTVIATDKTGTLTQGLMKVTKHELSDKDLALKTAVYANNLEDPLEIALWDWAQKSNLNPEKMTESVQRTDEEPFSSRTKYMSVTIDGTTYVKGAPEVVMDMSRISKKQRKEVEDKVQKWADSGLRMVGCAVKKKNNKTYTWVGLIGMEDPVRENIDEVLLKTHEAGIRTIMITGDYEGTARAVWKQIQDERHEIAILNGSQIENLSDQELQEKVMKVNIYARVSPDQKLRIVEALRKNGEVVALVGDGVNDAPALKKANIGIVVGSASDVSKETADMVLLDSNFKTIVAAIEEGRGIFDNIRKVILYLLSDAFAEIILVVGTLLLGLPLPLTAAQILWINVITDGLPAISLTFEPKEEDLLKRKPIDTSRPLLDAEIASLIGIVSGVAGMLSLGLFMYYYAQTGDVALSRTVTFAALAFGTTLYIFSIRSLTEPLLTDLKKLNPYLLGAVGIGIFLQCLALFQPDVRFFLSITEIGNREWMFIALFSVTLITVIEITKYAFYKLNVYRR